MNTKISTELKSKIYLSLSFFAIFLMFIFGLCHFSSQSYAKIIFISKKSGEYVIENHCIPIKKKTENYLNCLVDDFLLGSISPLLKLPFSKKARKENSFMGKNGEVYINFNPETFNECEDLSTGLTILTETIKINKKIKSLFIFVDGKSFRYIGSCGPLTNGIQSNCDIYQK